MVYPRCMVFLLSSVIVVYSIQPIQKSSGRNPGTWPGAEKKEYIVIVYIIMLICVPYWNFGLRWELNPGPLALDIKTHNRLITCRQMQCQKYKTRQIKSVHRATNWSPTITATSKINPLYLESGGTPPLSAVLFKIFFLSFRLRDILRVSATFHSSSVMLWSIVKGSKGQKSEF